MKYLSSLLCLFVCLYSGVLKAQQTTGKISGRVVDKQTGEPLPGANIVVVGTQLGAASDRNGEFFILNIPPGKYDIRGTMMGYTSVVKKGVFVNINRTTQVNLALTMTTLDVGEEVVVVAEREKVRADVSFSTSYIQSDNIEMTPATSIENVIARSAGINKDDFGLQIRGMGEQDIAVYVDGMTFNDNRNDRPYTTINYDLVKEIEILTGGFSAEYGNARAGVINLTTKESADRYTGSMRVEYSPAALKHFGPYAFSDGNWWDWGRFQYFEPSPDLNKDGEPDFMGWNAYTDDPARNIYNLSPENNKKLWDYQHRKDVLHYGDVPDYIIQATFGGPIKPAWGFLRNTSFYLGLYRKFEAYAYQLSKPGVLNQNVNLKIIHKFSPTKKLTFFGMYGEDEGAGYDINQQHDYISDPNFIIKYNFLSSGIANTLFAVDNISNNIKWYNTHGGAKWTHMISPKTYYDIRFQGTYKNYWAHIPEEHPFGFEDSVRVGYKEYFFLEDRDGQTRGFPAFPKYYSYHYKTFLYDQNGYWLHRLTHSRCYDKSNLYSFNLKFDITSQISNRHQLRAGVGHTFDRIQEYRYAYGPDYRGEFRGEGKLDHTEWDADIHHGYAYFQDKMEFKGIIVNAGLRFDYWKPVSAMYDLTNNWSNEDLLTRGRLIEFREQMPKKDVAFRYHFSPRLGVAHPITVNSKIYFNYGHFVDIPDPNDVYWIQMGSIERLEAIGSPDLNLSKSIMYEVGYEHDLGLFRVNLNGYYHDIRDDVRRVSYTYSATVYYNTYRNDEYKETKGFEIRLDRNFGSWLRGFVNYEHRFAVRGSFGPTQIRPDDPFLEQENAAAEAKDRARNSIEPVRIAKASLSFISSKNWGPAIMGFEPLANWILTWDYYWRGGTRFHWDLTGTVDEHVKNWKWRDYNMLNLKLQRRLFENKGFGVELYLDVYNVFNIKNFNVSKYGAGISKGSYTTPGDPSRIFAAHGLDGSVEFDNYMKRIQELGKQPGDEVEYEYMPKREYVTYLFPRDIWFGLRFYF